MFEGSFAPDDLPDTLELPSSIILKHWHDWLLWRAVGRRLDYSLAQEMPALTLQVNMLLDDLYSRLEAQHQKRHKNDNA